MSNIDLLIVDDDLRLNSANIPDLIYGVSCIAQDIKHMIRESGLLVELIGNRDFGKTTLNMNRIEIKIENDQRIKSGTAKVTLLNGEIFVVTALTINNEIVEINV